MSLKDPASGYTTVVSVIDDLSVALTEIRPFRNLDSPSPSARATGRGAVDVAPSRERSRQVKPLRVKSVAPAPLESTWSPASRCPNLTAEGLGDRSSISCSTFIWPVTP
jgi:hypothetical protein